jgi:hypothetical protein
MNQNHPELPIQHRFRERLAESRYFTISLLLHVILLLAVGTIVFVQQRSETYEPIGAEIPTSERAQDPQTTPINEQPPEQQATTQVPETKSPPVESPQPPASAPKIPVVNVKLSTGPEINILVDLTPTPPGTGDIVIPGVHAKEVGLRFDKDGHNHIMPRGLPNGVPRPTQASEEAVLRGLRWLRDHQNADGSWGEKNKSAMTGLGLLCFLGHGELPESKEFGLAVNRSVQWLINGGTEFEGRLSMTKGDWGSGNTGVYEHAIATYALGEFYTLTEDQRVLEVLRPAIAFIVAGQGPDGGWSYRYDKSQGDTSVSGWQVQALKAAHLTKLNLPGVDAALDQAMKNFDRVQGPNGGYGYRGPEDRYSLTGVGVLSELFWRNARDRGLHRSVEFITAKSEKEFPLRYQGEKGDLYAWYYHAQAMCMFGGGAWSNWDRHFTSEIVQAQTPSGDWPPMRAPGVGNLQDAQNLTGQVYRTSLCILMLEVYYRYLPANRAETSPTIPKMAAR